MTGLKQVAAARDLAGATVHCTCGRDHRVQTRVLHVGEDALDQAAALIGPLGKPLLVADENTWAASGQVLADKLTAAGVAYNRVLLDPHGHADAAQLGRVIIAQQDAKVLVAVGTGTINDTTRYAAFKVGAPYLVVGTAPSMDGYASSVSPLLVDGFKITYEAVAPEAVLADTDALIHAPEKMIAAGYGDIMGKLTALADWQEVEDKDVTVRKADLGRDIRSFISYAVGCMFGRYSIYKEGLIYAGGEWNYNDYENMAWIAEGKTEILSFYSKTHFFPDQDNIIPICDDEYFVDDIVHKFIEFVGVVYGTENLHENIKFIADALGGKGQPKDVIRNYFLNDFYKDHCKIYQKRPIYWLFDSGKKNGFKALIYMHRYQPDTIARIRTDYVHEQQSRYRTAIADLEKRIDNAATGERVKLNKELNKLQAQAEEIRVYEEKIHHLADQMISIDLDDGVKHNYEIFKDVLAKIK